LDGYYGTISRKCIQDGSNGNWDSISGSCDGTSFIFNDLLEENGIKLKFQINIWIKIKIAVNCPYIPNEGNAEWNETLANGQTINGTCINGYYGIVSRNCTQDGSNGNWNAIIGSCDGILIFSSSFLLFLNK